ncbi:MAG: hypothetical protein FWD52_00390 [Candidatus Bathyarchaeota archaeon]|nr:hypothetical protein [Candidatus Termiticorpusculum sp.]
MSSPLKPDGTTQQLLDLLSVAITSPQGKQKPVRIIDWMPPLIMLKTHLQNNTADYLISIRTYTATPNRIYNSIPLDETARFEIAIWSCKTPAYHEPAKSHDREQLTTQIKQFFGKHPQLGTVESVKNNDHLIGQMWAINTNIIITQQKPYKGHT